MMVMALGVLSSALHARVRLLTERYDFGVMHEADGRRQGRVLLVNDSTIPTVIRQVRPSCGCTDADYYKEVIMPGDTAWVTFDYNPIGRPGPFEKTVKVLTDETKDVHVITITGSVIGTPETLARMYPVDGGVMRLTEDTVVLMDVKAGRSRHAFVNVYNAADTTLRPKVANVPAQVEAAFTPDTLAPGALGTVGIFLDTKKESRRGPLEYKFQLVAGADTVPLTVRAVITE